MEAKEVVNGCTKIFFHILQITILIFGVFSLVLSIIMLSKTDSLFPIPLKYLIPTTAMCILSIANGYLGFVCLNSERKTKTFLFIFTLCWLMNFQVFLTFKSNLLVENNEFWINERWNAFSLEQKDFIQKQFSCCGLETITDRVGGRCDFSVPCAPFFKVMLKTIRSLIQKMFIIMFLIETISLSTFGLLKFIK